MHLHAVVATLTGQWSWAGLRLGFTKVKLKRMDKGLVRLEASVRSSRHSVYKYTMFLDNSLSYHHPF